MKNLIKMKMKKRDNISVKNKTEKMKTSNTKQ